MLPVVSKGKVRGNALSRWTSGVPCDALGSALKVSEPQGLSKLLHVCGLAGTVYDQCTDRQLHPAGASQAGTVRKTLLRCPLRR